MASHVEILEKELAFMRDENNRLRSLAAGRMMEILDHQRYEYIYNDIIVILMNILREKNNHLRRINIITENKPTQLMLADNMKIGKNRLDICNQLMQSLSACLHH